MERRVVRSVSASKRAREFGEGASRSAGVSVEVWNSRRSEMARRVPGGVSAGHAASRETLVWSMHGEHSAQRTTCSHLRAGRPTVSLDTCKGL